jgi:hypothetical protein
MKWLSFIVFSIILGMSFFHYCYMHLLEKFKASLSFSEVFPNNKASAVEAYIFRNSRVAYFVKAQSISPQSKSFILFKKVYIEDFLKGITMSSKRAIYDLHKKRFFIEK